MRKETFELFWMKEYQHCLNVLQSIRNKTYNKPINKVIEKLVPLVLDSTIRQEALKELEQLQQYCQSKQRTFALCHCDIHGT